jgi:hypothetical protein
MNDHSSNFSTPSGQSFVRAEICDISSQKSYPHPKGAFMKKFIFILCMSVLFSVPASSHAIEVSADVTGIQDSGSLKAGIEKTVITRCVSRGIQLEGYKKLTITISKLGDTLSYDALLDSTPPRAYHKDLKDMSTISGTIDEMIGTIFESAPKFLVPPPQAVLVPPAAALASPQKNFKTMAKLPLIATSIALLGERIFISDTNKVYELKGDKTSPIWQTPGKIEVLRMYPFNDTLIVLGKLNDRDLRTFKIKNGKVIERWDRAVFPIGSSLVSSDFVTDQDISGRSFAWMPSKQVSGTLTQVPAGLDMICAVSPDSPADASQIISYDPNDRLTIYKGKEMIWKSDTGAGIVPSYLEDLRPMPPTRYYLKPRIILTGGKIVTFWNDQGFGKMISRVPIFNESNIFVYTATGDNEFEKTTVANFPDSYCSDITLISGKVAALVVKEKKTYLQLLDQ